MQGRLTKAVWACFGVTPIAAYASGEPDFALVSFIAYLTGWGLLMWAVSNDRRSEKIESLIRSRGFAVVCLFGLIVVQFLMFAAPKIGFGFILFAFLMVFATWARARSARDLKQRFARLLLVGASIALCVTTLELGLGIAHWNRPRDGDGWTWGHEVQNNSLGFRERDFVSPKPVDTFRVMVVGDSLTWGAGLSEDQRYTNLLQNRLRQLHPGQNIEVLNFALSGAPTVTERDVIKANIAHADPDLLILGFCTNDPQTRSQSYAVELDYYRTLFKLYRSFGKHTGAKKLANFMQIRTDNLLRNTGLVPQHDASLDRCYDRKSPQWQDFCAALDEIVEICEQQLLPAPIFVPLLHGNGDFNMPNEHLRYLAKWCEQAATAAQRSGFVVVDLASVFLAEGDRVRHVNPWDGHPDAKCNTIYAGQLAPVVSRHFQEYRIAQAASQTLR